MEYNLTLGGIGFHILSHDAFTVEESFAPFIIHAPPSHWNIEIEFSQAYSSAPKLTGPKIGEDLLLEFYRQDEGLICAAKGGQKGPLAITVCDPGCSRLVCYMNTENYPPLNTLGNRLRLIPMRMILQKCGMTFLHAAQIAVDGKGILFTAPSGTGKTTQAKLWHHYRGAEIICNDRTLIRNGLTYGYPMDGSEPVCSSKVHPLGAIVLLAQNPENKISRLRPGAALSRLMPQIVFDGWDSQARDTAAAQLLELYSRFPIYQLDCRPDVDAVRCLEERLKLDGVIS